MGALNLAIVTKQAQPIGGPLDRQLSLLREQRLPYITATAAGEGDQTLGCSVEPVAFQHWPTARLPLEVAARDETGQVVVTDIVLAE